MKQAVAVLVVALVMLAFPATASAHHTQNCASSPGTENEWSYANSTYSDPSEVGVYANIEYHPLHTCIDTNGFDGLDGQSQWIALVQPGYTTRILQVGVIRCHSITQPAVCTGNPQFFYALGDCAGNVPSPQLIPGAVRETGDNYFEIGIRSDNVTYDIRVNGSTKKSFSKWHPDLQCWLPYAATGQFACETWDKSDACGYTGSITTKFKYLLIKPDYNTSWTSPGLTGCSVYDLAGGTDRFCWVQNPTTLHLWSQR
jgi:hypothetical protein